MGLLVNILYQVTIALKVPVMLGLVIALAWVLYEAGAFLRQWVDRARAARSWGHFLARIPGEKARPGPLKAEFFRLKSYPTLVAMFAGKAGRYPDDPEQLDKLISDIEIEANRLCHRMRVGVRVGPMLGLMGTLIPMGPALMSLSTGNLEEMATNLVIAFSTTVIGLVIGAVCLVMLLARQHWYARDLSDIEHLVQSAFFPRGGPE
jgi:biopolymer transport protein ExbB/TolQ